MEAMKLSLLASDMPVYVENPVAFTKAHLDK